MNKHFRNVDIAELVRNDIDHHFHPFTDHKSLSCRWRPARHHPCRRRVDLGRPMATSFSTAMSGLWCVNVGYGRKELAEAAYRQMLDLPYYNTFFKTTTVPATELAAQDFARPAAQALPAHFLRQFGLGSQRHHRALRAPLLEAQGQAVPQHVHRPAARLSRLDDDCRAASAAWQGMHEQGGLPLAGLPSCAAAVLV